jgi:hypothetical protein
MKFDKTTIIGQGKSIYSLSEILYRNFTGTVRKFLGVLSV